MNWLEQKILKRASAAKAPMIKESSGPVFNNCTFSGPIPGAISKSGDDLTMASGEDRHTILIPNHDRYGSDSQRIWVFKSANKNEMSVVFELRNERDGILSYSEFWQFKDSEEILANRLYSDLIKIGYGLKEQVEYEHIPIALVAPMFKKAFRGIAISHKEKSNIYGFNWSMEEPYESDWRETIYGARYPDPKSPGAIGEGWINSPETSKTINSDGALRGKTYSYK